MNSNHQDIIRLAGTEEILCQLMEECAELAQAAYKLRRCISGKNSSPVSGEEAAHNIIEEFADVTLCLQLLGYNANQSVVQHIRDDKAERWVKRLQDRG